MKGLRAFTLVESLVVMGIIAVLAALLFSVLNRTRHQARAVYCLNNLRRWGVATHLFTMNNDDLLPQDGSPNGISRDRGWYIDLPAVMGEKPCNTQPWFTNANIDPGKSIWICPSNGRRSSGSMLFHYCLNEHVNGTGGSGHMNQIMISSIPKPAATVWLFDNGGIAGVAQQNNVHSNLHGAGAQFSFVDGHAARFSNKAYWDFKAGKGRTNNPGLIWIP